MLARSSVGHCARALTDRRKKKDSNVWGMARDELGEEAKAEAETEAKTEANGAPACAFVGKVLACADRAEKLDVRFVRFKFKTLPTRQMFYAPMDDYLWMLIM